MNQVIKLHLKKEYKTTLAQLARSLVDTEHQCNKCFKNWTRFFSSSSDGHICGCIHCWSQVRVEELPFKQVMGLE